MDRMIKVKKVFLALEHGTKYKNSSESRKIVLSKKLDLLRNNKAV